MIFFQTNIFRILDIDIKCICIFSNINHIISEKNQPKLLLSQKEKSSKHLISFIFLSRLLTQYTHAYTYNIYIYIYSHHFSPSPPPFIFHPTPTAPKPRTPNLKHPNISIFHWIFKNRAQRRTAKIHNHHLEIAQKNTPRS